MLIVLGSATLRGTLRDRLHVHAHRHGDLSHAHLHFHAARHGAGEPAPHRHPHAVRFALRPFLVGGAHGLAGSAALALLVMTEVPTILAGCLYLLVFGAGSTAGMTLMSLVLGAPLVIAQRRAHWLARGLRAAAGLGSLGIGMAILWQTGVTGGLFG